MKKFVSTVLAMLLCVGLLSGCGTTLEGEDSVVYVDKKGTVYSLDVEAMDQDYYDSEELEAYVDEVVSQYTSEHGSGSNLLVESLSFFHFDELIRCRAQKLPPAWEYFIVIH